MAVQESLEAQQEEQKLDDEYNNKSQKYIDNPDLVKNNNKKANDALYGTDKSPEELERNKLIVEIVKELRKNDEYKEEATDTLYEIANVMVEEELESKNISGESNKGGIEGTKDKIGSRLDLDEKQVNNKLNNTSERKNNLEQASKIFFGKEQIIKYSNNPKSEGSNSKNLKKLGDSIIKSDKIVDEDLENILGNFIIEIGEEKAGDYALENPEEINEALNNAFELQIEKVKDGKVNYRTETVENLKKDILSDDLTNPLEKLEKFKKLEAEVNTSVGSIAKKREKATNGVEKSKKQLQEQIKNLKSEANYLEKNKNKDIKYYNTRKEKKKLLKNIIK